MRSHILAVDQGTSSTKCLLVDDHGAIVARGSAPVAVAYPRPGWVEQSPTAVLDSVYRAIAQCLSGQPTGSVLAVGLSTQRESVMAWDRATGEPLGTLLSWQDRRQQSWCAELAEAGHADEVERLSGLPLDPMFSAAKARWLLADIKQHRPRLPMDNVCLGTVDSWLVFCLSGRHVIETGNASRTQLVNVQTGKWDDTLLHLFDVPGQVLPEIVASTDCESRITTPALPALSAVPIGAVLGDSHSALFAHGATSAASVKATYGTGSSIIALRDATFPSGPGIATTIVWSDPVPHLAVEGNVTSTGATLVWLASLLDSTAEKLAGQAAPTGGGVHIVPAFGGLSAPYWDGNAVALIDGLTLATDRAQLAQAAIESTAFQVADVVNAIGVRSDTVIYADGGASANDSLMQLQADIVGAPVLRSQTSELSALGAARMAGATVGLWVSTDSVLQPRYDRFEPRPMDPRLKEGWRLAVARARLTRTAEGQPSATARDVGGQPQRHLQVRHEHIDPAAE